MASVYSVFLAAVVLVCLATTTATPVPRPQQDGRDSTQRNCTVPSDIHAKFLRIHSNADLATSLLSLNSTDSRASASSSSDRFEFISGDPNEGRTCPTSLVQSPDAPLAHRSLCPYYFDILRLPDGYYPRTLRYARCKCQRCVENEAYGCEAVTTSVALLKPARCSPQGFQMYEEHIISIPTACVCRAQQWRVDDADEDVEGRAVWIE